MTKSKEEILKRGRIYYALNADKIKERVKKYKQENKKRYTELSNAFNKDNPLRFSVKKQTYNNFVRQNRGGKDKCCSICSSSNNLQIHHWVYSLPVERRHFSTLCVTCHKIQHMTSDNFNIRFNPFGISSEEIK